MNNNNIECDLRVDKVQQVDTDDGRIMTVTLKGEKGITVDMDDDYDLTDILEVKVTIKCAMAATLEQIGINAPRIAKTLSLRDTNARLDQLEAIA